MTPLIFKSFLSSLPAKINGQEKVDALTFLAEGAKRCGDDASLTKSFEYEYCDVGAIIGNAFEANPKKVKLKHYNVRRTVIETQERLHRYWLSVDSNVFIYRNAANPHKYLRYSFNGVFPCTGIYCNEDPGEENWINIRRDYNMDLEPWRTAGNHILICLQRPMGWSMRGRNLFEWLDTTFANLRQHTDRPMRLRWHPGDWKNFPKGLDLTNYGVTLSDPAIPILQDLKNCWAVVCHNSTPSAVSAIEGIPVFITDDPGYCQAGDIANTDFSKIEDPWMPDRERWIRKIAQCHWSFEDLKSGRCWAHMRQWVKPRRRRQ